MMSQVWPENARVIFHLDMDAFFAAIEELDEPEYRGKPLVVGADPKGGAGRGVVSTANYEARKYGIHSALPISQAYKKCPHAIFVRGRYARYAEISGKMMAILKEFSPVVQQISIDEAFLDLTGATKLLGQPMEVAGKLKTRIKNETGLTASVGIASNKFIAKVASDLEKPDGLTICFPGNERAFLAPLPIRKLWGVGKKTAEKLAKIGLKTIDDIAKLPQDYLIKIFGKWGLHLWQLSNGIDTRPVDESSARKSISEETTFDVDVDDYEIVEKTLFRIADRLSRTMRRKELKGRTITLKLRWEGFETHTRSKTISDYVNDADTLRSIAVDQFRKMAKENRRVRLVGIGISQLNNIGGEQMSLFGDSQAPRNEKLENLLSDLKAKFGESAVTRAALLEENETHNEDRKAHDL
jgi:nucleotidyltransferase/DNA polymerase involved in DNA repair